MKEFALITGASGGIGYELAQLMAEKGHNLILVARNEAKLVSLKEKLEKKYSITVYVLAIDLSKVNSAEQVVAFTQQQTCAVRILINNAGFGDYAYFNEAKWEKLNEMIDLNIKSLTHLTHLFVPQMIEAKKGKILNVASIASFLPGPLMATYYATKAYVLSLSEALNNELSPYGITVTALCPGPTESGFQQAASMDQSKLVTNKKMPSSKTVAAYGYHAMIKGKAIAIEGLMNKIMVCSIRFTPRWMAVKIVRYMQDKRSE
jgi:uncharacterized protein